MSTIKTSHGELVIKRTVASNLPPVTVAFYTGSAICHIRMSLDESREAIAALESAMDDSQERELLKDLKPWDFGISDEENEAFYVGARVGYKVAVQSR